MRFCELPLPQRDVVIRIERRTNWICIERSYSVLSLYSEESTISVADIPIKAAGAEPVLTRATSRLEEVLRARHVRAKKCECAAAVVAAGAALNQDISSWRSVVKLEYLFVKRI